MRKFEHRYAKKARVLYAQGARGEFTSHSLVITPSIPINASDPNYDSDAAGELQQAVYEFCKAAGDPFKSILYVEDEPDA